MKRTRQARRWDSVRVGARLLLDTTCRSLPALVSSFRPRRPSLPRTAGKTVQVRLSGQPVATVSERFVSFDVDVTQVVGGKFWTPDGSRDAAPGGSCRVLPYDFSWPQLLPLARALAPAYLRIGGTASDEVYYDIDGGRSQPPPPYKYVLTRGQWDAANRFALAAGLETVFTLNAGPGPRDAAGHWTPDNARQLIAYSRAQGYPVGAWALGNEPNLFPFAHGLWLSMEQFAQEHAALRALLDELSPGARLLGPACAFWPAVGELLPVLPRFLPHAGRRLDVVTWHYYPQQSRRSPFAVRRATLQRALDPAFLDEVGRWAAQVEALRARHAPQAELWLQETGNAQCGGEPGLSDRFLAGFWWLDQLGQLARRGQQVVMRHNLSGTDYGLLDHSTLQPNPDYWNCLLWRRLMGQGVLEARASEPRPGLRLYAHRTQGGARGSATLLALNLDRQKSVRLDLDRAPLALYLLSADDPLGKTVLLNGRPLAIGPDGAPPEFEPAVLAGSTVELPPVSYAFVVVPGVVEPEA